MSKRVLLVDDSETVIQMEKLILGGMGFEVTTAKNGKLALDAIKRARPDVVLLDLVMPVMDGIETCLQLKSNPETKSIPIVIVTTRSEARWAQKAVEAGCDDYVLKPIDRVELLSKIKRILG